MTAKARRGAETVVEATKVDVEPSKTSPDGVAPASEAVESPRRRVSGWLHLVIIGACYLVAAMLVTLLVDAFESSIDGDDG